MTNKGLSYSKDKTKATLGHIPVCDILGAESLGEDSFHLKLVRTFTTKQGYLERLQFPALSRNIRVSLLLQGTARCA